MNKYYNTYVSKDGKVDMNLGRLWRGYRYCIKVIDHLNKFDYDDSSSQEYFETFWNDRDKFKEDSEMPEMRRWMTNHYIEPQKGFRGHANDAWFADKGKMVETILVLLDNCLNMESALADINGYIEGTIHAPDAENGTAWDWFKYNTRRRWTVFKDDARFSLRGCKKLRRHYIADYVDIWQDLLYRAQLLQETGDGRPEVAEENEENKPKHIGFQNR